MLMHCLCIHRRKHGISFLFLFFNFLIPTSHFDFRLILHFLLQADCELVKIDIHCHTQGDVVLECITLDSDLEREQMMFRVMFNTAFIRSNILMLNRDEIDILWNARDQFPKDFRIEVFIFLALFLVLFRALANSKYRGN